MHDGSKHVDDLVAPVDPQAVELEAVTRHRLASREARLVALHGWVEMAQRLRAFAQVDARGERDVGLKAPVQRAL